MNGILRADKDLMQVSIFNEVQKAPRINYKLVTRALAPLTIVNTNGKQK